ncbi:MAG TPA: dihydroxy-acid dehydratase [Asticcacaulis sp.]|nr:dihydroxy-acid dehydratase [Asticcacaulis sp.]
MQSQINTQTATPFKGSAAVVRAAQTTKMGDFAILHGSLAPAGCVIRLDGFTTEAYDGRARVFESAGDALAAVHAGRIRDCDIVIIRHEGDNAYRADDISDIGAALEGAGIERVTIITDGHIGTCSGSVIGQVAPSASARGPIAYVNDDDIIHIDVAERRIDILADIDMRRAARVTKPGQKTFGAGALEKYARMVASVTRDGSF